MIGKRALILTLLIVVVVQVVFPINHANAQVASRPDCASRLNVGNVLSFVGTTSATWLVLAGINFTTSTLASISVIVNPAIAGFSLGGFTIGSFFEPLDEAVDYLYNVWVKALFWGIVATFGAALAGYLVEFAIDLNLQLLTNNDIINVGYGTVLSLVNLGFVIAIIIIAFATMFRRSGWDMQSSLAKLIIAALLVNFSLFLAGIVLDLGTSLTRVLLSNACPGVEFFNKFNIIAIEQDVSEFLSKSVVIQPDSAGLLETIKGFATLNLEVIWGGISSYFTNMFTYIAGKFFVAILSVFFATALTIIGALSLLAIFLFLIARYVAITILLIFMPIAWLGLIFPKMNVPGLGNAWSGWWAQFLKWVFMGPLLAFFLWLTVQFIDSFGSLTAPSLIGGIGQMIVVIVFSLSALLVANKLGVVGAGMVYDGVDKVIKSGATSLKATGIGIAASALRTGPAEKVAGWMAGGKMTIPRTKFKIPTGTKEIGRAAMEAKAYVRKQAEGEAKKYGDLTYEQQNQMLTGMNPRDPVYAKIVEGLVKTDKLDPKLAGNMLDDKRVKRGLELNQRGDLYKKLEQLDMNTTESRKAMVEGRIDDARKIIFERFKDDKIDKDFGKNIANVYKRGDAAQMKIITEMLLKISPEAIKAPLGQLKTRAQRDNFERSMDNVMESSRVGREMKATEETESLVKSYVGKIKRTTEIEMEKFKNDGNKRANIMRESDAEIEKIREHGKTSLEDIRKEIRKTFTEFDKAVPDRVKEYWPSIRKIIHSGEYKNEDVVEREELELYTKKGD